MRPRISQKEAVYLVTVLAVQLEELKQKLDDVKQLERDYSRIIFELKHPVQVKYTDEGFFAGHHIWGDREKIGLVRLAKALKDEHTNLLAEKFRLFDCISTHEVLLKKYKAIANGEPHDGRYKRLAIRTWHLQENSDKLLENVLVCKS